MEKRNKQIKDYLRYNFSYINMRMCGKGSLVFAVFMSVRRKIFIGHAQDQIVSKKQRYCPSIKIVMTHFI